MVLHHNNANKREVLQHERIDKSSKLIYFF